MKWVTRERPKIDRIARPWLIALSLGISEAFTDDHAMLKHGMVVYDALYAWSLSCPGDAFNWPPAMS